MPPGVPNCGPHQGEACPYYERPEAECYFFLRLKPGGAGVPCRLDAVKAHQVEMRLVREGVPAGWAWLGSGILSSAERLGPEGAAVRARTLDALTRATNKSRPATTSAVPSEDDDAGEPVAVLESYLDVEATDD